MPKIIGKVLMTNHSKFRAGNTGYACYFAGSNWPSNFCQGYSNHLGTFSSKMECL